MSLKHLCKRSLTLDLSALPKQFDRHFSMTVLCSHQIGETKKQNSLHTYKEIVAFMEGKRLDEISAQQEIGKRPYQKVMLVAGSGAIVFAVMGIVGMILKYLGQ